jgi:hypothetical protein
MKRTVLILSVAISLIFMFSAICAADGGIQKCSEQTLIVGASYIELSTFDGPDQFVWSSFTIRNVDPENEITVVRVDFHTPDGEFFKGFIPSDNGVVIASFESKTWRASPSTLGGIDEYSSEDGRPFFIVEWVADKKVIPPMIFSVAVFVEFDTTLWTIDYKAATNIDVKVIDQKSGN